MMDLHVGDLIFYPNHGLGIIEEVNVQLFGGVVSEEVYTLRLHESNSRIMVPVRTAASMGIRRLTSPRDAQLLLAEMAGMGDIPEMVIRDWKQRYKANTDRLMSGRISDVARVLVCLALVNQRKALSFREKKMYDRAKRLLVTELAAVEKSTFSEQEKRVDQALFDAMQKTEE